MSNPVTAYREMLEAQERFLLACGWRKDPEQPEGSAYVWMDPHEPPRTSYETSYYALAKEHYRFQAVLSTRG